MKNPDLAVLRETVTAMHVRVATVQQRDAFNRAANGAPNFDSAIYRSQAAALTSKLGRMSRCSRRERREAARALAKAERRAAPRNTFAIPRSSVAFSSAKTAGEP